MTDYRHNTFYAEDPAAAVKGTTLGMVLGILFWVGAGVVVYYRHPIFDLIRRIF